jgi:hypothetical protein
MDLWSPGGLHLESVGEGKLHVHGQLCLFCVVVGGPCLCAPWVL